MSTIAEPTVPPSPGDVVKAMRVAHEEGLLRDVAARKAQLRQLRRLLVENEERLLAALDGRQREQLAELLRRILVAVGDAAPRARQPVTVKSAARTQARARSACRSS